MAQFKSYDACRNVCSTSNTGALTLGDNVTGAQSIKAKMSTGDTAKFYFRKGSQWISFLGTFTAPDQLARTRIIDGSGGLATNVDFAAGAGEVAIDVSAEDLDLLNTIETSLTSAATFDIGAVYALRILASGTTGPVTSLGTVANKFRIVRWAGATLTCNTTSFILRGLANGATRVTANGDIGTYASDASGNWRELDYVRADGTVIGGAAAATTISAAGLATGGGDLSANRTITVTAATQSDQETGSSLVTAVTPGRQQFHPSAAKAWARFNSAGTLQSSYNVSSISDNGTGNWTVNIGTDFSSTANHTCLVNGGRISGVSAMWYTANPTADQCGILALKPTDTLADPDLPDSISYVGYGDQA